MGLGMITLQTGLFRTPWPFGRSGRRPQSVIAARLIRLFDGFIHVNMIVPGIYTL